MNILTGKQIAYKTNKKLYTLYIQIYIYCYRNIYIYIHTPKCTHDKEAGKAA